MYNTKSRYFSPSCIYSSTTIFFIQAVSMDGGTVDTMDNVRRAEKELVSVKSQVTKIVANWTNTVININKVDIFYF